MDSVGCRRGHVQKEIHYFKPWRHHCKASSFTLLLEVELGFSSTCCEIHVGKGLSQVLFETALILLPTAWKRRWRNKQALKSICARTKTCMHLSICRLMKMGLSTYLKYWRLDARRIFCSFLWQIYDSSGHNFSTFVKPHGIEDIIPRNVKSNVMFNAPDSVVKYWKNKLLPKIKQRSDNKYGSLQNTLNDCVIRVSKIITFSIV